MSRALQLRCLLAFAPIAITLPLAAQAPRVHSEKLGFSYALPDDWQAIVPEPRAGQPGTWQNTPEEVKKGIACVEVPMTARHGEPASVVVVIALPFDCFGATMPAQDLAEFGSGVTEGLKTALDFLSPVTASYALAGHDLWIERIKAVPKGKTEPVSTVEITCTILEKGAVCWMVQAADEAGLQAFEGAAVTLEGSPASRLVPTQVFAMPPVPAKSPH